MSHKADPNRATLGLILIGLGFFIMGWSCRGLASKHSHSHDNSTHQPTESQFFNF